MLEAKQLFSQLNSNGTLNVIIKDVDVIQPKKGEVLIKMLAVPINPSDLTPIFNFADLKQINISEGGRLLTAPIDKRFLSKSVSRHDLPLAVGNEGAGEVVAVGEGAESLLGKIVSIRNGACLAQYACVAADSCLVHKEGTNPKQAASSLVNPMTALCMIENMKLDGHKGIIHTAAASTVGQMLNRLCLADNIPLINVVRSQAQVELLKSQGAKFVVDTSSEHFSDDLYSAIAATNATLIFDAVGGGRLASDILSTMEAYLSRNANGLNTYGSDQLKQVYIYGRLDLSLTTLNRDFGFYWSISGWLFPKVLERLSQEQIKNLENRVVDEISTTFKTEFSDEISLEDVIQPDNIATYYAKKTGSKFVVNPHR